MRGEYGKSLLRRRGELVERSFAHCYETGAMRRCHLRGQENIWKRQLIHVGATWPDLQEIRYLHPGLLVPNRVSFSTVSGNTTLRCRASMSCSQ